MPGQIPELLHRNLQEVFGEGDAARRRAAIGELYTQDCMVYAPPGILVGHEALDKFAGDLRGDPPGLRLHPAWRGPGAPQCRASRLGVRAARRTTQLHGLGCGDRPLSDPEGSRHRIGALLLGYYTPDGDLIYAGRVGTGMPVAELERLYGRLQPLSVPKMPLSKPPLAVAGSARRSCSAASIGCGQRWWSRSRMSR
jgi:hypothetical protein